MNRDHKKNDFFLLPRAAGPATKKFKEEEAFVVRSVADDTCLQPELEKLPHFDAVAFEQPDGSVSLVVLNTNDQAIPLTVYDQEAEMAVEHTVPAHAIHTYRYSPPKAVKSLRLDDAAAAATAVPSASTISLSAAPSSAAGAAQATAARAVGQGRSSAFFGMFAFFIALAVVGVMASRAGAGAGRFLEEPWPRASAAVAVDQESPDEYAAFEER